MIPKPNTSAWLDWRKDKIGASDAAIILGISPWSTPLKLWEQKVGLVSYPEKTHAMIRGIEMEEKARQYYEKISGEIVFPQICIHPSEPWCIASLDGITLNQKKIVEIKCPSKQVMEMAKNAEIPPYYYAQLQHQMMVTGLSNADYFCFNGESGFLITIDRDDKYIEDLMAKEKIFYECMVTLCPPPSSDSDYQDFSEDKEFCLLESYYIDICLKLVMLEADKEALRQKIISHCLESNAKGKKIKVTKKISKGRIDFDKIECLKTIDLEPYRKPNIKTFILRTLVENDKI